MNETLAWHNHIIEMAYNTITMGTETPDFIFASRSMAVKWLYDTDLLELWLPVLVPSGPGFSCV